MIWIIVYGVLLASAAWGLEMITPLSTAVEKGIRPFVPTSPAQVTENLYVALVALLGAGTFFWLVVKVIFRMRWYDALVGDGVDILDDQGNVIGHKPPRWMRDADPEPYLVWAMAWLMCYSTQWNAFAYIHGYSIDEYFFQATEFIKMGFGWPWVYRVGWHFQVFLTAGAVAQGPDFLREIAERFSSTLASITKALRGEK